jgi:glycosyltransferase involved in cell wall biosynthesis
LAVNCKVIFSAAHAEFADTEPLGGGKAVADHLVREWRARRSFPLTVLSPRSLAVATGRSPAALGELGYARFCRQFERAATAEILARDPRRCVVLSNDISEGPDFAALGTRGYRVATIFHVDVVEFFSKFYLRGWARPETLARAGRLRWLPDVLRLVVVKQADCLHHSRRIIVPSAPMRDTIRRCYPWCPPERITVLPWGNVAEAPAAACPAPTGIGEDEFVILTLSRLSPEKGIDRLLRALRRLNASHRAVRVVICGAPAYMRGRAYERKLRRLAGRLDGVRVVFAGHVTGATKQALLERADLFVSASRHESYGLTIAEAQAAGCRVLSHPHYGARGEVVDCADRWALAAALSRLIAAGRTRKAAPAPPGAQRVATAAERVAALLAEL